MADKHWVVAEDNGMLLAAMMEWLASPQSRISFEGWLGPTGLDQLDGALSESETILKRRTPPQEFIVFPLEKHRLQAILECVIPADRISHEVQHVEIERGGQIEFASYNRFHPDAILCGSAVPVVLLEQLVEREIIKSYAVMKEA